MEFENAKPDLRDFPHSFQLHPGCDKLSLRRLLEQEDAALKNGMYRTPFEIARVHNFIAFILCNLCKGEEALQHIDKVLRGQTMSDNTDILGQKKNIVSLANKIVILREMGRAEKAAKVYKRLQRLRHNKDFRYLKVLGKAELAECYNHLGHQANQKAIGLFKEVILNGREPEVLLWRYSLALAYKKAVSLQCASTDKINYSKSCLSELQEVIKSTPDNTLKAKAYAEIAWLIFEAPDRKTKAALKRKVSLSAIEACTEALVLDNMNSLVLHKVCRLFRYVNGSYLNRACDLLVRAAYTQGSSMIYRELGLSCKAMALRSKKNNLKNRTHRVRKVLIFGKTLWTKKKYKKTKVPKTQNFRATIVEKLHKISRSSLDSAMMKLSPDNELVAMAVNCLEKAVELQKGQHSTTIYDLAFMYKVQGREAEALTHFDSICTLDEGTSLTPYYVIAAFAQCGLILLSQSQNRYEADNTKKKQMRKEGLSKLKRSLQIAATVFAHRTPFQQDSKVLWKSISILMEHVDEFSESETVKLKAKIQLVKLIRRPKELRKLFGLVKRKALDEEDVDSLKLCIKDYLLRDKHEAAVPFMDVLVCTAPTDQYLKRGSVQKVYINAARKQLLNNTSSAKHALKSVFAASFGCVGADSNNDSVCSSSNSVCVDEVGDEKKMHATDYKYEQGAENHVDVAQADSSVNGAQYEWDVMLLHDHEAESKAKTLVQILRDLCGLTVTRMDEDVSPTGLDRHETMNNIERSCVFIILLAAPHNTEEDLELFSYLNLATCRNIGNVFVIKLQENCHIPRLLMQKPIVQCHPALWEISWCATKTTNVRDCPGKCYGAGYASHGAVNSDSAALKISSGSLEEASADALCDLFYFLTQRPKP